MVCLPLSLRCKDKMKEDKFRKKIEFQQKVISRQSEQIDSMKLQIEELSLDCAKKDETINSITPLRNELIKHIDDIKEYKKEYEELIEELKDMKKIMNQEVYNGKWKLVRFLIK